MAASLAVRARQLGLRSFVLTVDPARRLATSLGVDLSGVEARQVAGGKGSGTMTAAVIDSKRTFDDFIRRHSTDPELVDRLSKNRLYQQLSTTLAGSQEFTSLERLLQAHESGLYDVVILDTPPTQHALDFLSAPDRIRGLFQDTITRWFMNPEENSGFLGQAILGSIIGRGTRVALKSLEVLTGAKFIEELIDFFASMRTIQKTLRDRSEKVQALLRSKETEFVLVTSFDVAKLQEAQHLGEFLRTSGYTLGACILNRAFPERLPHVEDDNVELPESLREAARRLREFHARVKADHEHRFQILDAFEARMKASGTAVPAIIRVPEYRQDLFGLEDLESLADFLGESKHGS